MTNLIRAGQILTAGEGQGQLSQYYGYADVAQTVVTATGLSTLSTKYTIPAGEPYAGAAYELSCAGIGAIGTVQHNLQFAMEIQGTAIVAGLPPIAAAALNTGQAFAWALRFLLVSADGVSAWWGSLQGSLVETGTPLQPGTAGAQAIALASATTLAVEAPIANPVTMAVDAAWGSGPDGCTITNMLTTFRKIA